MSNDVTEDEVSLVVDPPTTDVAPDTIVTQWVYLAGPMSNLPGFNFPLFFEAAAWLRSVGIGVFSPAEKDLESIPWDEMQLIPGYADGDLATYCANSSFTMSNAMEWDLPAIQRSSGIVLLPGWEGSTGARWERIVAEALGRTVYLLRKVIVEPGPDAWELTVADNQQALTEYLRGFNSPQAPSAIADASNVELVAELRGRFAHVPGASLVFDRLEASVVL